MGIYCTEEFKAEVEKLGKKGSYESLEQLLVENYCDVSFDEAANGRVLSALPTGNPTLFYLKKTLDGSGGYRAYVLAFVKEKDIYLGFIHPKTGVYGIPNISTDKRKEILKEVILASKSGRVYELSKDPANSKKLLFTLKK
jgi:hypothetical protein